jgi:hypothetical protein
MKERRTELE